MSLAIIQLPHVSDKTFADYAIFLEIEFNTFLHLFLNVSD